MKERRRRVSKVHFRHNANHRTMCGLDGLTTMVANNTTCRVCMFHYLAESASWARQFLDDLRGRPAGRPRSRDRMELLMPLTDEQRERVRAELHRVARTGLGGEFAGPAQGHAVAVPGTGAEPVDGKVKGLGDGSARAFSQQTSPEKAVSVLLTGAAPLSGAVQVVVDDCRASADTIGVQPGKVAEEPGDTGQISDEAWGHY